MRFISLFFHSIGGQRKKSLWICLLACCLCCSAFVVSAADGNSSLLSERVSRKLVAIQRLLDTDQQSAALNKLTLLLEKSRLNVYERAVVNQTLGYVYAGLENYPLAIQAFDESLKSNALADSVAQNLRLNVGQLHIAQANYREGVGYLETWLASSDVPNTNIYEMIAIAYYKLEQYEKAVTYLKKSIDISPTIEKSWLQMLIAIYFEREDFVSAKQQLTAAIKVFPHEKSFWQQLVYAQRQLKQYKAALATMALSHKQHLLDSKQIVVLAKFYIEQNLPHKAAQLLTAGLEAKGIANNVDNVSLLAESWLQAKELDKAAELFQQAATLSQDNELYYRAAQVYTELRDWQSVVQLQQGRSMSAEDKKAGAMSLLTGIAYFELNELSLAKQHLQKALADNNTRRRAKQWLKQLEVVRNNPLD